MSPKFDKRFQQKPKDQQVAILKAMKLLGDNPQHPSLRVKGIKSAPRGVMEARYTKADRISWEWGTDGSIVLRYNCHHEDVFARP